MLQGWGYDPLEVRCRECRKPLGYYPGSPRDFHDKDKLCAKCEGEHLAKRVLAVFTKRLTGKEMR